MKQICKKILDKTDVIRTKKLCRKHHLNFCDGVKISKDVKIKDGTKVILSPGCWISHHCSFWGGGTIVLGKNTHIGSFSSIFASKDGGVSIGDEVNCSRNMFVIDSNHSYDDVNSLIRLQPLRSEKITIGNDVWIAANVTIVKGASIGNGCVVGACSLVNKKFGDGVVLGGVPAAIIKKRF